MARDGAGAGPPRQPDHLSRGASDALARRRRGRNLALLAGLLALAALFYFISIAKLTNTEHPAPAATPATSPPPAAK